MDYDRDRWQMEIKRTPVEEIMRSLAFETGVDDARKGYPPRYDDPMRERLRGWKWTATANDSVRGIVRLLGCTCRPPRLLLIGQRGRV
jgi:hypothetical protein